MYKANSGALVFSAGTIQWAWGLGEDHDGVNSPGDTRMQQATINMLLGHGRAARQPDDRHGHHRRVDRHPGADRDHHLAGQRHQCGQRLAGDGAGHGERLWAAAGWPASRSPPTAAAPGIRGQRHDVVDLFVLHQRCRLAGDPGPGHRRQREHRGAPSAPRQLTLTGSSTLFGQRVPVNAGYRATTSTLELGVRFTPETNGFVTGVRFYKGTGNTGTHTGSLWSNTGTRLATGTFTGESSSGWQTLTFPTPVSVAANTKYVASYLAPNGGYANDSWAFSVSDLLVYPLSAMRSTSTAGNGLFKYGGGFPNESYNDTNYWVDTLFTAAADAAPIVTSTTPEDGASAVAISTLPAAVFSKSLNPASIVFSLTKTGGVNVPGTVSYNDTNKTVTFTPSASLAAAETFTASVQASDPQGHAMTAPTTWTFSTDLDPSVSKLFATNAVPANPSINDGNAVELGVKFTPSVNGTVIGRALLPGSQ